MDIASPDSPGKRLLAIVVGAVAVIGAAAWFYYQAIQSAPSLDQAAALHIIRAAEAFTHDRAREHQPIPATISLQNIVALNYLKPEDATPFQGMQVTLALVSTNKAGSGIVMSVHLPDGGPDITLLENGATQTNSQP